MQAFEFAKQLLLDLRRQKIQILEAEGEQRATNDDPVYLRLPLGMVSYDDEQIPLKEVTIEFLEGDGDNQKLVKAYTLEVPKGVDLHGPEQIDPWLEAVFEFVATLHGMALTRAEITEHKNFNDTTDTQVFLNKDEWSITWQINDGLLSDVPVEIAGAQMDVQMKRTLDGWKDSPVHWNDNPDDETDYVEKGFKNPRQAQVVQELMTQLMVINGMQEEEVDEHIQLYDHEDGRTMIKLPKEYLEKAVASEQYLGL